MRGIQFTYLHQSIFRPYTVDTNIDTDMITDVDMDIDMDMDMDTDMDTDMDPDMDPDMHCIATATRASPLYPPLARTTPDQH